MELRYQMTDILPLLPIPQPPYGKSAYNIPCPLCDKPGTREKHLNINLKRNVYRCPKCGQFQGGVFDLYAYYMASHGISAGRHYGEAAWRYNLFRGEGRTKKEDTGSTDETTSEPSTAGGARSGLSCPAQ